MEPLASGGVVARQVIDSIYVHSAKQYEANEETEAGRSIVRNELQPENVYSPSVVTPSGILTAASAEQSSKAEVPNEVTVLGSTTELSMLQPLNA